MSALSRFRVYDDAPGEYFACLTIGASCAIVSMVGGLYVPSVHQDEWGDAIASGQGMRTAELAADAAILLAQGHHRAMAMAFGEFGADADVIVHVADAT